MDHNREQLFKNNEIMAMKILPFVKLRFRPSTIVCSSADDCSWAKSNNYPQFHHL